MKKRLGISSPICLIIISLGLNTAFSLPIEPFNNSTINQIWQIIYPQNNEEIENLLPMISVRIIPSATPCNLATIKIFLDETEITSSLEITPTYIVYEPQEPLTAGPHTIKIIGKDINNSDIAPLIWQFIIIKKTKLVPVSSEERIGGISGSFKITSEYTDIDFIPSKTVNIASTFANKEGLRSKLNLNFASISAGRTANVSFSRDSLSYSNRNLDKLKVAYKDKNFKANIGDFSTALSELTLVGASARGVSFEKKSKRAGFVLFAGRTQSPSFSGTFKQYAYGAKGTRKIGKKNTASLIFVSAEERANARYETAANKPAKDFIWSFQNLHKPNKKTSLSFAAARNFRYNSAKDKKIKDFAYQFLLSSKNKKMDMEAALYDIGENFLPVAEGSSKYLKNNRKGFRIANQYRIGASLVPRWEYEEYRNYNNAVHSDKEYERQSYNLKLDFKGLPVINCSSEIFEFVSDGTSSKANTISTIYIISSERIFGDIKIESNYRQNKFTGKTESASSKNYGKSYGLQTSMGESLEIRVKNMTDKSISLASSMKTDRTSISLDYDVIPFELIMSAIFDYTNSKGYNNGILSIDNNTKKLIRRIRWLPDDSYSFLFEYEQRRYSDKVNSFYSYSQNAGKMVLERKF